MSTSKKNTTAPRTTYPKSYILERIDARLNTIKRLHAEHTALIEKYRVEHHKALNEYCDEMQVWTNRLANVTLPDLVKKAHQRAATKNSLSLEEMEALAGWFEKATEDVPKRPNDFRRTGAYHYRASDKEKAIYRANSDRKLLDKEEDDLQHARAHLVGTPVEEFSLTGLRQLGLLEVIKFNLGKETGK